jgi:hypothetical protein
MSSDNFTIVTDANEPFGSTTDHILVVLYIITHAYCMFGRMWAVLFLTIFLLAIFVFKLKLAFVTIVFISYLISDLLINQRLMRNSDYSTRKYGVMACTVIFSVTLIMMLTGAIEPYQGAIAFLALYVLQARYARTIPIAMQQQQLPAENSLLQNTPAVVNSVALPEKESLF